MDDRQIDELLQQAEQRLGNSSASVPVTIPEKEDAQLVPRPTVAVPRSEGGVRPALAQQSTTSQAKVSQNLCLLLYIPLQPSDEKEPLKVL